MPEIKIKHVVSCSSEDRNNPAENLLKAEGTHKWKTATTGEKQATVILQFEKASQISSIDIGNEGSAFVEVLVGKSTFTSESDYQVLLVSSSFMSPADSRSGTNRNAVRIFTADKLNKTTLEEKWDRVKIVCSQPFNKSTPYGLSFIKLHSDSGSCAPIKEGMKQLGAFFMKKEDSEEDDDIRVGALFASKAKKEPVATVPPTGAAAIRAASRLAEESRPSTSRASLDRGDNSPASNHKGSPHQAKASPRAVKKHDLSNEDDDTEPEEETTATKPTLKRQSTSLSSVSSAPPSHTPPSTKKIKSEPPKASAAKQFGRLMETVTFVLSGFQNPYRGQLRDKALEMGATYRPDWGRGCTHLICAFTNTPKYKQVQGKGRIVSKDWINDCYKQRKLLPWRKYRLGDAETPDESSEEEAEELRPTKTTAWKKTQEGSQTRGHSSQGAAPRKQTPAKAERKTSPRRPAGSEDEGRKSESDADTDEEIRQVQQRAKKRAEATPSPVRPSPRASEDKSEEKWAASDLFNDSTDEDENNTEVNTTVAMGEDDLDDAKDNNSEGDSGLPDLPDFFSDKHFLLYGDFNPTERRLLTRYIAAYNGELEDYMNSRVKYVVTSSRWDDNFKQALSENPRLVFVKPQWIHSCHEQSKLVPHQSYIVAS